MSDSTLIATQNAFRRGPGGRPTRAEAERRHRALLDTAARLFITRGLDGVSLEAIAEEAGVAKRFVYARYRDKGDLFADTLRRLIQERLSFIGSYEVGPAPVDQGLQAFAEMLEVAATQPEALALYRLVITELHRFPALSSLFVDKMRLNVLGSVTRVLTTYQTRGEVHFDDPVMATELFVTLVVQGARGRALVGIPETPAEMRRRTEAAVRLFLDGYRVKVP
ncbi:TetR family transcriptional regulator [Labrys miyagiensis]|uniref:TetR family transcriptional regulator n=1 Tax=Labrys miyagiensis TaxID=346912 RepID=A0ABQ6CKF4_9HYPH|nr:TetR/AcrR family transcriptional regulator [Labrys miyagiensis]GLS20773.1 TetR family transcriptional regulator [Labrys miyagiensis]